MSTPYNYSPMHIYYAGVAPMGLFSFVQPAPGQKEGLRLLSRDVTTPLSTLLTVHSDHGGVMTSDQQRPLAEHTVHRWYMGPGVQRYPVRVGRIRATLFLPPGPCAPPLNLIANNLEHNYLCKKM